MLRECEYIHLEKNNFVILHNPEMVCVTYELWQKLMDNEDNQELVNSLKKQMK